MKRKLVPAVSVVLLLLAVTVAGAQTATPSTAGSANGTDQWRFSVIPYIWGVNLDGKVTIGNYSTSSSMTFSDIMSDMRAAGEVHFEAQKGRIGFFFDPTYIQLREDTTLTGVPSGTAPPPTRDLTLTSEMWLVEFGGFYQAATWLIDGKKEGRTATVDLLAGGRYWYMRGELDMSSPVSPSETDDFLDPMIGARVTVDLTHTLNFRLKGDIAGFGVGSDFTWNVVAGLGYRFSDNGTALLGYRYLYMNYKPGTSRARYQITMQGPMAGIMFAF